MTGIAEFKIIGRVGAIKDVGTTVRVSIASNYSRKDNRGEWVESVKSVSYTHLTLPTIYSV